MIKVSSIAEKPWMPAIVGMVYFCFGGAMAFALFYQPPLETANISIYVLGRRVDPEAPLHQQIASVVRRYLAQNVTLTDGESFEMQTSLRDIGIGIDLARLERSIEILKAGRGDVARYRRRYGGGVSGRIDVSLPIKIDYERIESFLLSLKYQYDMKPADARFDMERGVVIPHRDGRSLLLDETIAKMELALSRGLARIPLEVRRSRPLRRTEDLSRIDIDTVLGWYETPYCQMKKCWDRNHNLELGAKILDGTIIGSGEIFDFNAALGPRTEVRGFRPAPTIEQGVLTLSPGGGTCQTASTLYAAAFFAGLDLVQRRPHSRPSGYILLGLDATVTYPHINLLLRNPFDFPVVIHYKVADGKMRVEIRGKERRREVHFVRRITQIIPHTEKTVEEPQWPRGVSVVTQLGIDGYRVRRYRVVWEGSHMVRELTENYYPPTTKITHVGTNPSLSAKNFVPPLAADDHTPYTVDKRIKFYLDEDGQFKKIIASW